MHLYEMAKGFYLQINYTLTSVKIVFPDKYDHEDKFQSFYMMCSDRLWIVFFQL